MMITGVANVKKLNLQVSFLYLIGELMEDTVEVVPFNCQRETIIQNPLSLGSKNCQYIWHFRKEYLEMLF